MSGVQGEMKRAAESGYWPLYRYDPRLEHPMQLDSKEPSMPYVDYLNGENRYVSLKKAFPEEAERLFEKGAEQAQERYERYRRLSEE